jgi:mRNA-degrading endonuclease RelE of RelBE toxin-antitoxin system
VYGVHTVVETPSYLADAKHERMTPDKLAAVVDLLSANPQAGDLIVGSGGCRKVRVGGKGKGKSGGYRVVSFFGGEDVPVFLLAVLAKKARVRTSQRPSETR